MKKLAFLFLSVLIFSAVAMPALAIIAPEPDVDLGCDVIRRQLEKLPARIVVKGRVLETTKLAADHAKIRVQLSKELQVCEKQEGQKQRGD